MSRAIPIDDWPQRIEAAMKERCELFSRITALRETESTQDAARTLGAKPGDVITAWRQTAGRGRLGRSWADTQDHGIAATLVTDRREPEFLAIAAAVGAAQTIESTTRLSTQIKWPNDVLINGRKVAGVLVEQHDEIALIGIGINVQQTSWPADLADRAASLAQSGAIVDRLDVLIELIVAMGASLRADAAELNGEFSKRDALVGRVAAFRTAGREVLGRVLRVDPMRGIEIESATGASMLLPAGVTTVLHIDESRSAIAGDDFAISRGKPVSPHPVDR
jgi:BirA family biotin operon repressor/biotin-[acetyl-CoA-carboxylase] ligase